MEVCKTCGIVAGTHACNPLDINMKNMRLTIQNQQSEITRLNEVVIESEARIATMLITIEKMSKHKELSQQQRDVLIGVHSALVEAMSEKGDK